MNKLKIWQNNYICCVYKMVNLKNYKKHCVRTCFIFKLCYNDRFILN